MKMNTLFSYFLAIFCCGGMLFANPKMEEGERIPVTLVENVDEAIAAQEERELKAVEIAESSGEDGLARAMQFAPVEETSAASQDAADLAFGITSVVNKMSQAEGAQYFSYPGAEHPLVRFSKNELRLDDGSWWNIHSRDIPETYNWLFESSLTFLDLTLGLKPDTVVVTVNSDWPLYSSYRYHLTNQQTGKYVRANLNDFYVSPETRYIFSHVWLYDAYGNLFVQLTLNDGSVWNTLPIDTQCFLWIDGDVIIVGLNTDQYSGIAPYQLINVRSNDNGGAACVRYYK